MLALVFIVLVVLGLVHASLWWVLALLVIEPFIWMGVAALIPRSDDSIYYD